MKYGALKRIYIRRAMAWRHGLDLVKDCFTCTGHELILKQVVFDS